MNVNWQRYHGEQEKHVNALSETIKQLQAELKASRQVPLSEVRQAEIDRMLLEQKHANNMLEEDKAKVNIYRFLLSYPQLIQMGI